MKSNKLRIMITVLISIAMLITVLMPITISASADPSIDLSDSSGSSGDKITISGNNFTENYYYYIFFNEIYQSKGRIDENGEFTKEFTIPAKVKGIYEIAVMTNPSSYSSPKYDGDYEETATAEFEITSNPSLAKLTLSKTVVSQGEVVTLSGQYFTPDNHYYVFLDDICKYKGTIDKNGEFSIPFTIPTITGFKDILVFANEDSVSNPSVDDTYDESAEISFEVPDLGNVAINTKTGIVGDIFLLTGSGFNPERRVTVTWDDIVIGNTFDSADNGTFTEEQFIVPETTAGSHTIRVKDSARTSAIVTYTVKPKITLSTNSVIVGNSINVSGIGFKGSSTIKFYLDDKTLNETGKTSEKGTLSNTSVAILDTGITSGSHALKATDTDGNSASTNLNVSVPTPTKTTTTQTTTSSTTSNTSTTLTTETTSQTTTTSTTTSSQTTQTQTPEPTSSGLAVWMIAIIVVVVIIVVLLVVVLILRKNPKK
jgi:hypothetical protein